MDNDEIAQLATWTLDENLNPIDYSNRFFSVHKEVDEGARKCNGLTKSILEIKSNGVYFDDVKDEIYEELKDYILIAHNASFERRMLGNALDHKLDNNKWICTMLRYTPTLALRDRAGKGGYKHCNLRELLLNLYAKNTGSVGGYHDALYDTFCTAFAFNTLG